MTWVMLGNARHLKAGFVKLDVKIRLSEVSGAVQIFINEEKIGHELPVQ